MIAQLLEPFAWWPPVVGLTVVSLIAAFGLLLAFKRTSNQRAIAETKRQVLAGLYELRLFQDDPQLMLRAAADVLREQGRYLGYAFFPLLWVVVPFSLLLTHLQAHYGYVALRPGQSASVIVHVRTNDANGAGNDVANGQLTPMPAPTLTLDAPPGLRVETPRVWAPSRREGAWRIVADRDGYYDLRVTCAAATVNKRVRVTAAIVALSPVRPAGRVWEEWLHPAEPPLPADAPIDAITMTYPERTIDILGQSLPWPIVFFAFTTVFMLLGRRFLRVVI